MEPQDERKYTFVLICRGCKRLRAYRGSLYCSTCAAEMAAGWPDVEPVEAGR